MTYFSGFCLQNEAELFGWLLNPYKNNPYVVAGFSFGAQKALEYAFKSPRRIDRLILISPAWFHNKPQRFISLQLKAFHSDAKTYTENFLRRAVGECELKLDAYRAPCKKEELESLLLYPWPQEKLQALAERGVWIETHLGGRDALIDAYKAHDFFKRFGESRLYKPLGHFLCEKGPKE